LSGRLGGRNPQYTVGGEGGGEKVSGGRTLAFHEKG